MRCRVRQLRERGVRRPDHAVVSDEGIVGSAVLNTSGGYRQLFIHAFDDGGLMKPLMPPLFEAIVVNITNGRMLFRGVQKEVGSEKAATYFQEWLVEPLGG